AEIGISVLSHPHAIECAGEAELLAALNPDQVGLILSEQGRRALFLPKVWSDLPDPRDFLRELKRKGGWPADYWSADMRAERFSAEYF
ncbi:MAG: extradiol dioxygenase, partial [Hyphomicrobiales bacterium]